MVRRAFARGAIGVVVGVMVLCVAAPGAAYEPRHVFITNRGGGNVVELDEGFAYQRTWFDGEAFEGAGLAAPNGMAFTPDGSMFIADTGNDRLIALDERGAFVRAFSTLTRLGRSVESIYFDAAGTLYASANPGRGVVARFEQSGAGLADVVSGPAFSNLGNVNLTDAGRVIVADFSGMGRGLREIDPADGAVVHTFGADLGRQEDVMIDGGDRVFVSHFDGAEVVVYGPAPDRAELYRFTAPAEAPLALTRPTGIALTHDCAILVASFETAGVFVFRHEGDDPPTFERVLQPGVDIPVEADLSAVESIAISALGLPGSFDEFADRVPSCDEAPAPDAGPRPDAGEGDAGRAPADAGGAADAGPPATDPGDGGGCSCAVPGASAGDGPLALLLILAVLGRIIRSREGRSGAARRWSPAPRPRERTRRPPPRAPRRRRAGGRRGTPSP